MSVVILNWNGSHHLDGCFESLRGLDYPAGKLEVILVDNGSKDDSLAKMKASHGWVRVIANDRNVGFSAGCNQGAREADAPDVLVFLNNDMRVEPSFLRELVGPVARGECQASTAKLLSWDGKKMNSAAGGMNFHGIGIQRGYLEKPDASFDVPCRSLFPCGGAMAIAASVFQSVGGLRRGVLRLLRGRGPGLEALGDGLRGPLRPRGGGLPPPLQYEPLDADGDGPPPADAESLGWACFKNYDDANLARVFPAALALAVRRTLLVSGVDDDAPYRIERQERRAGILDKAKRAVDDTVPVKKVAVADLIGLNDLLGNWAHWEERRADVQRRRRRSDDEIFQLFLKPLWCVEEEEAYRELHFGIARHFGDRLHVRRPHPRRSGTQQVETPLAPHAALRRHPGLQRGTHPRGARPPRAGDALREGGDPRRRLLEGPLPGDHRGAEGEVRTTSAPSATRRTGGRARRSRPRCASSRATCS